MIDPNSPDTSLRGAPEPCARCGCGRHQHRPLALVDGTTARRCGGFHLSGGASGMLQRCGCPDYEPRPVRMARVDECPVCDGRGIVQALHLDRPMHVREIETCPRCAGTGALIVRENR